MSPDAYELTVCETFSSQVGRVKHSALAEGTRAPYAPRGEVVQGQYHFLYPATTVNVAPGVPNISLERWVPESPARTIEVTVTELRPDGNVFIGTQFGQILSGQCTAQVSNIFSVVGRLALNGPIGSGRYCVGIYDVGGLRETSTYTIRLSHP